MESKEYSNSPYIHIEANPSNSAFLEKIRGKTTILDVGCGETDKVRGIYPRCSWEVKSSNMIWIGCDPNAVPNSDNRITILTNQRAEPDQMMMFTREVDSLPTFAPNYISLVASNPENIVGGLLYDLEKFIQKSGQIIIIGLDNRTWESSKYGKKAKQIILEWVKENNLKPQDYPPEKFHPNSADLGTLGNSWYIFRKK